jgi:hypothetical protein
MIKIIQLRIDNCIAQIKMAGQFFSGHFEHLIRQTYLVLENSR